MTYLLFAVALGLSAVAAYYAVVGLIAIFAAAVIPIAIMGSLLEASKLVVASWLYKNWKEIPILLKSYFTVALVVLMLLTSMGIFGFLSKAHLDQAIPTGDVQSKLALIDEKIKTEKENINASRKELSQLDAQLDQTISRTTDQGGTERAIQIRRNQQKDRNRILTEIGSAQTKIAKLNEERAPIASEVRKVEAEVGPIKYIAQVIYGDADTDLLEKAVRFVTILIVLVFDPLAVLMLVAANWQLKKDKGTIEPEETQPIKEKVWDKFFKKEPANDFPEKEPEIKHIVIEDNIEFKDVFNPKEQDSELPEIKVDEHNKDWEPELFDRKQVKKIEYDSAGRRITPITEEELTPPTKTQSFLNKVQEVFSSPSVKTIEKEVEELQKK
jgi:hypothetical protein